MTTNYETAIDEMFALFNEAWKAETQAIAGYVPEVRWPGVEEDDLPDATKFWCRVSQQTVDENQTALAGNDLQRRYTAIGLVFVQLFCPKTASGAMDKGRKLATVAKKAFRGKTTSGKVWMRKARIQELSPEDNAYRFNIVAEYEYDEIG